LADDYDDAGDYAPHEDEGTPPGRKLRYVVGAGIILLWLFTLIGAGIWIDIEWRLDSTTKLLLDIVFFGLFCLGALLVANLTG
jgi:predicted transporter